MCACVRVCALLPRCVRTRPPRAWVGEGGVAALVRRVYRVYADVTWPCVCVVTMLQLRCVLGVHQYIYGGISLPHRIQQDSRPDARPVALTTGMCVSACVCVCVCVCRLHPFICLLQPFICSLVKADTSLRRACLCPCQYWLTVCVCVCVFGCVFAAIGRLCDPGRRLLRQRVCVWVSGRRV